MSDARSCPICGTPFAATPVERWSTFDLLECPSCGLRLWSPPLAGDATWYDTSDHYLAAPLVDWLGWYHRWGLEHVPRGVSTLLDIGCADGRFVYAAAARGIDARGIDHSERLVSLGNRRYGGSRLSTMPVERIGADGETIDVVTLFEVIEHVPDPLELLRVAHGLLRPGGRAIVSTPNRLGRPRPPAALDRPPHHLTRWTPRTLSIALERSGFEVAEIGLSPAQVGLTAALLGAVRLGLVVRMLRRRARAAPGHAPSADADVRAAILLKERLFSALAAALVPIAGRWFRGGSMVASAHRLP